MKDIYYVLGGEVAEVPIGLRGFPLPHFVLQKPTLLRHGGLTLHSGMGEEDILGTSHWDFIYIYITFT